METVSATALVDLKWNPVMTTTRASMAWRAHKRLRGRSRVGSVRWAWREMEGTVLTLTRCVCVCGVFGYKLDYVSL